MFITIGKFFASIAVGVSSLFGIHHAQQVPPVSVPTQIVSSTTPISPPVTSSTKVVVPAKPGAQQIVPTVTSSVGTSSHIPSTPSVQTPVTVVATPTPAVAPIATPKPIPLPKIKVTATPSSIAYDGTSAISWVATDAASCTLDSSPLLLAPTGSQTVHPANPNYQDWLKPVETKYTVTCTGAGGSISGNATVTVSWTPPAGYKYLPTGQCTQTTAPCTTGPGGCLVEKYGVIGCGG